MKVEQRLTATKGALMANRDKGKDGKGKGDQGKDISKDSIFGDQVRQFLEDAAEIYVENNAERDVIIKGLATVQTKVNDIFGVDLGQLFTTGGAAAATTGLEAALRLAGMSPHLAETMKETADAYLDANRRQYRNRGNKLLIGDVTKLSQEHLKQAKETKERLASYITARAALPLDERDLHHQKVRAFCRVKLSNALRWQKYKFFINNTEDLRLLNRLDPETEWAEHLAQAYGEVTVDTSRDGTAAGAPAPAPTSFFARVLPVEGVLGLIFGNKDNEISNHVKAEARRIETACVNGSIDARRRSRALRALNNRR
jgi:hypothetical protein